MWTNFSSPGKFSISCHLLFWKSKPLEIFTTTFPPAAVRLQQCASPSPTTKFALTCSRWKEGEHDEPNKYIGNKATLFHNHDLFIPRCMFYTKPLPSFRIRCSQISSIHRLIDAGGWQVTRTFAIYTPFRRCRPVLCNWLSKKYPSIGLKSVSE